MIEIEDVIEPTPTSQDSRKINAIDRDTIHRICSGQVVLNLATAVKELVENSIDAGATVIEIKLKEQGADLVEVADNGSGVEQKNFEGLTAKYHTSKLKEFSDLACIETFGFRGEALSSLCALSDMTITTRHETAPHGIKLDLDHRGIIVKRTPCARTVGTTVLLTNLFSTLPVRKKEFQKNIKREFIKMCQILQAYCLVSVGVRIICTNTNKKGVKSVIMSTQGTDSVLDNITTVFGAKQSSELIELNPAISSSGKIMDLNESDFDDSLSLTQEEVDSLNLSKYTIEGPCEPKSIMKLVNETYHRYNANQNPFVYLNLKMDRSDVDVNLTPDKRQILVNNEKILLLALKKSLLKTYGKIPSTFKMQNLNVSVTTRLLNISVQSTDDGEDMHDESVDRANPRSLLAAYSNRRAVVKSNGESPLEKITGKRKRDENVCTPKIHDFISVTTKTIAHENGKVVVSDEETMEKLPKVARNSTLFENAIEDNSRWPIEEKKGVKLPELNPSAIMGSTPPRAASSPEEHVHLISCRTEIPVADRPKLKFVKILNNDVAPEATTQLIDTQIKKEIEMKGPTQCHNVEVIEVDEPSFRDFVPESNKKSLDIDLSSLKALMDKEHTIIQQEALVRSASLSRLKFKSKINPSSNRSAEDELQTEISKDKFDQMEVIGQFNLGFIIARLDDDLFIVDQHATDEKYNFEDLQRTTVLQNQKLVVPQHLELTAVNEMILMDNLEVFEMNGFKFEIDGSAESTKKVKLVAKPFSKNWEFGKEDIDELIFMLQDAPNTVCRPSRVRAMFASRACRKSIMIGKALSKAEMKKLLSHMGEIEQPWNCPHGRPTMRHLVNLSMIEHGELTDQNVEQ